MTHAEAKLMVAGHLVVVLHKHVCSHELYNCCHNGKEIFFNSAMHKKEST